MELLVLFPLVGFILFWQRWQSASVSSAALHSVAAIILLLYIAGLLGVLPAGRVLLLGLGTALLVGELIRHRRQHLPALGSVPMLILLGGCALFFLVHGSSEFRYYDEFSHWGIYLKDMLARGGFWNAETNSLHTRYPPGPSLWQYLFLSGDAPKEGAAYLAQFLLLITPLLVLFESLRWRQAGWIAGIAVLVLFGFGNFGHGIASIYADHVLAAWLAGIFLNFVAEPRNRPAAALALYVLPLSVLALVKNAGLMFALALPILLVALLWLRLRRNAQLTGVRRAATLALLLTAWLAGPLLATAAWSHNRNALGTTPGALSAPGVVGILTGKVKVKNPERAAVVNPMFLDVFVNQQLSKNHVSDRFNEFSYQLMPMFKDKFKLTTASFLVLYIVWSGLLIGLAVPKTMRAEWAAGLVGMLGISLAYIVVLYLTYLFYRNDMVSYIRYVHTVVLALLLAGMAPLVPAFASSRTATAEPGSARKRHIATAAFTFSMLALLAIEKPHLQSLMRPMASPLTAFRSDIRPLAANVRRAVGDARLWLYLPDPNPHNLTSRIMLYELSPTPTTVNRDFGFFDRPRKAVLADWSNYDFVWLPLDIPDLEPKLRAVVGPDLGDRLYRIVSKNGGVELELELVKPGERTGH